MADLFSEPSVKSDIVLIVDDKRMYVNKTILSLASPVFEAMFESDFKEKQDEEIPLPGKKYDDFLEFLLCFYPHSMKPVNFDNVDAVLPLAEEYQVQYIKRKSDETLLYCLEQTCLSDKKLVHILWLADKYALSKARAKSVDMAACRSYEKLATVFLLVCFN
ncbi:BTB and MATH domain-containing protein 38-like [Gigantopelta aegis]|uniref:BTB and MATH domain-containing protein 38-like n=1 Tax=Gigantopelta aegis TaxID=1735272 RepID=UPI001B88BABA|nr:BTB and MATH domain-containing protein 38-like [Gigantopelta aegis]